MSTKCNYYINLTGLSTPHADDERFGHIRFDGVPCGGHNSDLAKEFLAQRANTSRFPNSAYRVAGIEFTLHRNSPNEMRLADCLKSILGPDGRFQVCEHICVKGVLGSNDDWVVWLIGGAVAWKFDGKTVLLEGVDEDFEAYRVLMQENPA